MDEPRRLLIPISTGMSHRNIHCTGLHRALVRQGLRPVYLLPATYRDGLSSLPPETEADVDVLPERRAVLLDTVLGDLAFSVVQRNHRLKTMEIHRRRRRRAPGVPLKQRLEPLAGRSWAAYHALRRLRETLCRCPEMDPPLRKWKPALVFSNNLFSLEEGAVLRRARRLRIPTVGMVLSWDNPSNKGLPPPPADLVLVWSEVMRDEMETLYRVPRDRMRIVGSPQFDIYREPLPVTRAETLVEYGFPPEIRLVLYATGAPVHCPGEPEYTRILADLVADSPGLGLLVRLHPRDREERYASLAGRERVVVAPAGTRGEGVNDGWAPTREDHVHFAALMRYADVVVNLASTIALDAAANDRPVIHVRFDPEPGLPYLDSVERLFDYTHTARLIRVKASFEARSPAELRGAVLRALEEPGALRERRAALARQEGVLGDGRSAERIAALLAAAVQEGRR